MAKIHLLSRWWATFFPIRHWERSCREKFLPTKWDASSPSTWMYICYIFLHAKINRGLKSEGIFLALNTSLRLISRWSGLTELDISLSHQFILGVALTSMQLHYTFVHAKINGGLKSEGRFLEFNTTLMLISRWIGLAWQLPFRAHTS